MATLQERNGSFRVLFLHHGKRHTFTLGKVPRRVAEGKAAKVEEVLSLLKSGYLALPPGTDILTFIQHDGKPAPPVQNAHGRGALTLGKLRDNYLRVHDGSLEKTTIDGIRLHFKHLVRTLGEAFPLPELSLSSLQDHADRRKTMKGIGGNVSSATIKKELVSLRTAWNWAIGNGWLDVRFPSLRKVRLVKPEEKPHFQTKDEIERRVAAGGLTDKQIRELWDALYLQLNEVNQLLEFVKTTALQPWVYPMFCFVAHTGARRSEALRALASDVDFEAATILIHEKKRAHHKRTTRRVPLTRFLSGVLKDWLQQHPGGSSLFCQLAEVPRSKKTQSHNRIHGRQHASDDAQGSQAIRAPTAAATLGSNHGR